jgi:O-antigen/teichoic acid export membrane protein
MLVKQTAIYFAAHVFSALFGLLNVTVFTRIFPVEAFGDYLLGFGFATLFATLLGTSIKLAILRNQARGDGTDVRPIALAGLLICILLLPLGYGAARLVKLEPAIALASAGLSFALVVFDVSQEILRAQQRSTAFLRGTIARAILVSILGIGVAMFSRSGAALLAASSVAFLLSALTSWRRTWGAARPRFDMRRLRELAFAGVPLTISLSLLSVAAIADRFLIANLSGMAAAAQFGASLDLVRQSLIIPAISVASAFVPMSVQLMASSGPSAARAHLEKCLELLLTIVLPCCVGFALVSPQIAELVLGPDFRQTAREAMPVLSIAVVFQILNQQYLHTSFLLSGRNIFWFTSTVLALLFNMAASFLLIPRFGVMGAVWGRLAAEVLGFLCSLWLSRIAFAMPFPSRSIFRVVVGVVWMALVIRGLQSGDQELGPRALLILIPAGVAVYGAAVWVLNLADLRATLEGFDLRSLSPASFWQKRPGASTS